MASALLMAAHLPRAREEALLSEHIYAKVLPFLNKPPAAHGVRVPNAAAPTANTGSGGGSAGSAAARDREGSERRTNRSAEATTASRRRTANPHRRAAATNSCARLALEAARALAGHAVGSVPAAERTRSRDGRRLG